MSPPPSRPKLYHITHVGNLPGILAEGGLLPDASMAARGGPEASIGMSSIKRRRIEELEVHCHPGTRVGDYVPFYFCPRSLMLYVIHMANHADLTYRDGQGPILHLEADLHQVVQWADRNGTPWAFSLSNAGAYYTEFRNALAQLDQLDWTAIFATDFRDDEVRQGEQAEFLVHGGFPWRLVERVGVPSMPSYQQVGRALARSEYRPRVEILPAWYY
jgi:hypothetical protein